jgi:hypothetical protein
MDLPFQTVAPETLRTWQEFRPAWLYASIGVASLPDVSQDRAHYPISLHSLGELSFPDGRIIACDPYLAELGQQPFRQTLTPGAHEVAVARAKIGPDHTRNAAALITVAGAGPIGRWEMGEFLDDTALTSSAAPLPLSGTDFVGYGVDAGTGGFLSPSALAGLIYVMEENGGMLEDAMSEGVLADDFVLIAPGEGTLPIAAFSTGWGDGAYPTWFGLDDAGRVAVVMTDFLLTGDPMGVALSDPPHDIGAKKRGRRWRRR